jgi:hypothetical protein
MEELNKEIKISDKKIIRYEIRSGYVPIQTVTYANLENGIKTISFSRWDDYCFRSYHEMDFKDYDNSKREEHVFEKDNPLYIPLLHLLDGEDELIIDDDETSEMNKKYMRICKEEEKIIVVFINELGKDTDLEKFNIFIKNIDFDLRSKIDCLRKDTKDRLYFFFQEVHEKMIEDDHQISMDEYLLNNNLLTNEESKKYVKKWKL